METDFYRPAGSKVGIVRDILIPSSTEILHIDFRFAREIYLFFCCTGR